MSLATLAVRADAFAGATRPGLLRRVLAHIVRARTIHVQRRLLNELPDHLLKDIGLNRSDIDYVAQAVVEERNDPTRQRSFHA
jgi:uncharacterized protein YjiS (DUF1127 family)